MELRKDNPYRDDRTAGIAWDMGYKAGYSDATEDTDLYSGVGLRLQLVPEFEPLCEDLWYPNAVPMDNVVARQLLEQRLAIEKGANEVWMYATSVNGNDLAEAKRQLQVLSNSYRRVRLVHSVNLYSKRVLLHIVDGTERETLR